MFPSITCMSIACNYPVLCHIKITPLSFMDILYILYVFYFLSVFVLYVLYIFHVRFLCNNYIYYLYFCQKEVRTLSFQPLTLCLTIFSQTADKKQYSFFTFPLLHSPLPVHPPPRHPERNSCQRHSCCHAHRKKDRIDSVFLEFRPVPHQHPVHGPVKCCSRNQRNCRGNQKYSYRRFMNSCHTFCIQSNSYC